MQRYKYIMSFVLLYLTFSYSIVHFSKSQIRFTIGRNRKPFNLTIFLIGFVLIVISSIRLNTGSDYRSYWIIYNWSERYKNINYIISLEGIQSALYILAFKLKEFVSTHYFGNSVLEQNILFIFVAVIANVINLRQIRKNSQNISMGIMVYLYLGFYMISNNLLKQQITMSIFLIAFEEFYHRRYVKYCILCAIACLFHVTVLLPAILLIFGGRKYIKVRFILLFIIVFFAASFTIPIFGKYFTIITKIGISKKYFDNIFRYSSDWRRIIYVLGSFIMYFYLYRIVYRHREEFIEKNDKLLIYMQLIAMGLIINAFSVNYWLLIRFSYYFYQFSIFLIPNCYESLQMTQLERKNLKILLVLFAMFFVVFSGENTYYGYHTVFNKNMEPVYLDEYIQLYE